jgi:uncharacterized protein GlcG (DUF336 family)
MRSRLTALSIAVLLGLAACGGGDDEAQDRSTTTAAEEVDSDTIVDGGVDARRGPRAIGGIGASSGDGNGDDGSAAEPSETFSPAQLPEPTESVIPAYEG